MANAYKCDVCKKFFVNPSGYTLDPVSVNGNKLQVVISYEATIMDDSEFGSFRPDLCQKCFDGLIEKSDFSSGR